jgi:hypothetical protein
MNGNAQSFVKTVSEEIGQYGKAPVVTAELCAVSAFELIGLLQLATRHPHLPERQRDFAKEMVKSLAKGFKPEHRAIAELIKRGWDQEFDVEVKA